MRDSGRMVIAFMTAFSESLCFAGFGDRALGPPEEIPCVHRCDYGSLDRIDCLM